MARVIVINHVTLDGVVQGPGRPDEDTRDGFTYGGWAGPGNDEAMAAKLGQWMGGAHAFLFGRRTYEGVLESWNRMGGPFKEALNGTPKYVASRAATTALSWPNSTLVAGEATTTVAQLKREVSDDLVMMGSGELIGSLLTAGLIDVFFLMIHPLVLGAGRRLFTGPGFAALRLTDLAATSTGVLLATYEPVRSDGAAATQ